MENVLEKILKDICTPEGSQAEDWLKIFETLEGALYAETLQNSYINHKVIVVGGKNVI